MTIYFAGSHSVDFNNTGNQMTVNTANDTYGDPGYTTLGAMQLGAASAPRVFGGLTDVWFGFTMGNTLGSASEGATATICDLRTSGGQGIVRLQNTSGPTRTFQYWNGSAWTNIGTLADSGTRHGRRIDIRCKIDGSAGIFAIYVDRILQHQLTGNTNFFSATIDNFQLNNWGQFNGRCVGEVVVASVDTRKLRVKSGYYTGNSATNTGWTGGFANLDENPTTNYTAADTDASVSSAGGQDMSFTKPAIGNFADDGAILAVGISVRAKNDGSSADFDMLVRSGGTNYTQSHTRTINTTNTNGYQGIWNTDPATGVAWTESGADACELGFQSKNAGVSTIYLATYFVVIQDDFIEPWEAGYPSASNEGISIQEITAPGSTGYVDITDATMFADGCSPTHMFILTNGGTSGGVNASAQQWFGFCQNTPYAHYSGKGGIGYTANDASASSSTQRHNQIRNLKDYATSNGGWLIDASGLRVRFEKFIKGGVRIFYETTTSGRKFSVCLFWGADLEVQYWPINMGTVTTAQPQTGIGFQPEGGIFFSAGSTTGGIASAYYSIGMAADDGSGLKQRCLMRFSTSGVAAGPQPNQQIDNTVIAGLLTSAGGLTWETTLNSFDADGFTIQNSASAVSALLFCILFRHTGGKKFNVIDITTPTVTGSASHNGAGFTPGFTMGVLASNQTLNTIEADNEPASSTSFFMADPSLNCCCVAMSEHSTLDPSETNSYQDVANAVRIGTNSATVAEVIGDLTGYGSDGLTVNYTTVSATQKLGFALVFEASAGGPPPGVGSSENGLIIVCM